MPRYAFKIEYNGQPFKGWQRQDNLPTVQGAVEDALRKLQPDFETIAAAGRTDTGVHGLAQVAHADLARDWDTFRLSEALNYHLKPHPVAVLETAPVADDWHARFDATERRYLFRLLHRRAPATHEKGLVWQINHPLNLDAMQSAATYLIGQHDFTTFRSTMCQAKSPVKTLDALEIDERAVPYGTEYRFTFRARSFLHNQVRSFVGSLERVGAGAWPPEQMKDALDARDRAACGPVCPPGGLYLAGVSYPNDPFTGQ
ncbi:tRNA pseudouridine38-40 synthase [Litoreibacter ponti]|uniref:tRNA pseudouridine synthase A n=1 Tax=Litoreibacter ponti TaxID=1510457 RepID=A0A2T6BEA2_9RHOB|nr:tRNA pseudouridine(38-40) synthase TruA [Litoreibacter ponti]PTX54371.1 tRNA pseudouridine38-40 synthase [Litoreibacter ponti]